MKHHIVILQNGHVFENMMSKISTPRELRARLAKKWSRKYAIYFYIDTPYNGTFRLTGDLSAVFEWFIDIDKTPKIPKPKSTESKHLIRSDAKAEHPFNTYDAYEGDVITILPEKCRVLKQNFHSSDGHTSYIHMVDAIVNGKASFIKLHILRNMLYPEGPLSPYEVLRKFSGKTFRIIEAIRSSTRVVPRSRGLITGKPLNWWLMPEDRPSIKYKYEFIE